MNNIVDVVGLNDVVDKLPDNIKVLKNKFEQLYSILSVTGGFEDICEEIETRIYNYFKALELSEEPTIYDYWSYHCATGKMLLQLLIGTHFFIKHT